MKNTINTLILLLLAATVRAQVWPTEAIPDPNAASVTPEYGRISVIAGGSTLSDKSWTDQRMSLAVRVGLGSGLGVRVSSAMRSIKGYGAFQNGICDSRVGLSFWPQLSAQSPIRFGINGNFVMPTGYRQQEYYRDADTDSIAALPPYSLKQTAGEIFCGMQWMPHTTASFSAFAGYFSTADKVEQAFRWGLGTALAPFGPRYVVEVNYAHSQTRTGIFPNTEAMSAGVALKLGWGFTIAPGVWADLKDKPLYGGAVSLRVDAPLSKKTFPKIEKTAAIPAIPIVKQKGTVLVPPPQSELNLASGEDLWRKLREQMGEAFEKEMSLPSLDLPGLPYDEKDRTHFWNTMAAIAAEFPGADWLLLTHVEKEEISRADDAVIPLLVSHPGWAANCRLRIQLIDLTHQTAGEERIVEVQSIRREGARLAILSAPEDEVISFSASKQLTLDAYDKAGAEVLRQIAERR